MGATTSSFGHPVKGLQLFYGLLDEGNGFIDDWSSSTDVWDSNDLNAFANGVENVQIPYFEDSVDFDLNGGKIVKSRGNKYYQYDLSQSGTVSMMFDEMDGIDAFGATYWLTGDVDDKSLGTLTLTKSNGQTTVIDIGSASQIAKDGRGFFGFVLEGRDTLVELSFSHFMQPKRVSLALDDMYVGIRTMSSGVYGDPHFVGFNDESFDFDGIPGFVFNLVTTKAFQINSRFASMLNVLDNEPRTLMEQVAVMHHGHRLVISSDATARFDGKRLPIGSVKQFADCQFTWNVSSTVGNAVRADRDAEWFGGVPHIASLEAQVVLPGMLLSVYVVTTTRMPGLQFLDIDVARTNQTLKAMHGVIGQTGIGTMEERGLNASCVEGKDTDYWVRDGIFGTDFKYNMFLEDDVKQAYAY